MSILQTISNKHQHLIFSTSCIITSLCKPPGVKFKVKDPSNFQSKHLLTPNGYDHEDENGTSVQEWAEINHLILIYGAKLPAYFHSRRWRQTYNPDLIFSSNIINK